MAAAYYLNEDLELVVDPDTEEQQMKQSVVFYEDGSNSFGYFGEQQNPEKISSVIDSPFDYYFFGEEKVKEIEFIEPIALLIEKMYKNTKVALTRRELENFEGFVLVLPQVAVEEEKKKELSDEIRRRTGYFILKFYENTEAAVRMYEAYEFTPK